MLNKGVEATTPSLMSNLMWSSQQPLDAIPTHLGLCINKNSFWASGAPDEKSNLLREAKVTVDLIETLSYLVDLQSPAPSDI